jgi:hypothetical protein
MALPDEKSPVPEHKTLVKMERIGRPRILPQRGSASKASSDGVPIRDHPTSRGRFCWILAFNKQGRVPATRTTAKVDNDAACTFLRTAYEPADWVAIFLKSYERSPVSQRVGPVSWVQTERFQRWLRAMNAGRYNVFVSVNAIALGRRARTRDAIGAVRHVFLDADPSALARIDPGLLARTGPPGFSD